LHEHLPASAALFNEFHALLVEAGKRYCKREVPRCEACPLEPFLNHRHVARADPKGFAFAKPPAVSGVSGRVGPTLKRMEIYHH
jgi:adenine-specific DNA glycosylase